MKNLLPVTFTKMSGAGNTFVLIDARQGSEWSKVEPSLGLSRPEFARKICSPTTGVGADGLLLIQQGSEGYDFEWDFYNSDGSTAEMCGNAARCAARFCEENISATGPKEIRFKTGAGLVTTEVLGEGRVRVKMPEAHLIKKDLELKTKSSSIERFTFVNTGVPHLVQRIHDMGDVASLKDMAREIREHTELRPAGANVTFYTESSAGFIEAITYERGVEDYTLACGTGAVAAALVYGDVTHLTSVQVKMPGGSLHVSFDFKNPHPEMTGEAIYIGEFKYSLEVIR